MDRQACLTSRNLCRTKRVRCWVNLAVCAFIFGAGLTSGARGQSNDPIHAATQSGSVTAPRQAPASKNGAPTEDVTITGTRSQQVIESFVRKRAVATRLTGKIARWREGICPITIGLPSPVAKFITTRVKALGTEVGAPVNGKDDCRGNIEIIFTASPQLLLDDIRKHHDVLLGYADNNDERDRLSKVTRDIQAWYTTATEDFNGSPLVDSSKTIPAEMEINIRDPSGGMLHFTIQAQHGFRAASDSHLGDGLRSTFYNIVIVADPGKLIGQELGTVADYIGLLALAQINPPDDCQSLASILDLLTRGCTPAKNLTENDLAYLRGLYRSNPDAYLRAQEDDIAYQMEKTFKGH